MAPSPLYSSPDRDSRNQEKIKQLSDCGVDSTIFACDICEKSALGQAFEKCANKLPSICRVIQAAVVPEMRYSFLELEVARL